MAHETGLRSLKFFPAEHGGGVKTVAMFKTIYQDVTFMPTGGIFLTGSVATMLRNQPLADAFYDCFQSAPTLPNLPKEIRCALINDPFAALKGCAFLIESEV